MRKRAAPRLRLVAFVRQFVCLAAGSVVISSCGGGTEPSCDPTDVSVGPATRTFSFVGETFQFSAEARRGVTPLSCVNSYSWTSSNTTVATVSSTGLVTAVANGTASISATGGGATGKADITVTQVAASVQITKPKDTFAAIGEVIQLTAKALDNGGHEVTGKAFTWSASDTTIVAVDNTGKATAVKIGSATITATTSGASGDIKATAALTVTVQVAKLVVTPTPVALAVGETLTLAASALDAGGHPVSGVTVSWESSNTSVATVDASGVVTAVAPGQVTMTAVVGTIRSAPAGSVNVLTASLKQLRDLLADTFTEDLLTAVADVQEARLRQFIADARADLAANNMDALKAALTSARDDAAGGGATDDLENLIALSLTFDFALSLIS
jgi:uncharacterized protein YjdB